MGSHAPVGGSLRLRRRGRGPCLARVPVREVVPLRLGSADWGSEALAWARLAAERQADVFGVVGLVRLGDVVEVVL